MLLASCVEGNRELTEADLSAFGTFVDSLDTSLQGKWFTRMGLSDDADSLLRYLRRELPRNGLDTAGFSIPQIAADIAVVQTLAFDSVGQSINEVLPRLDSLLTKAYVVYTTGQRYGFMYPVKVMNTLDTKPKGDYARLIDYEVKKPDQSEAQRQVISEDRMAYLVSSQPSDRVYKVLQEQLVKANTADERRKIAVNLERCRWQMVRPQSVGRQVIVNIPAQQLWAMDADSVLDMKICCGAKITKTPLLHSAISYLQVNPDWIVPQNIVDSDMARHGGDSAYFARHRYYIVDRTSGDTLNPVDVGAGEMKSGRLRVGQKGGTGNSLGHIVFRFPNNFSVYLHDTNNRGAFNREQRTLSHGCIRVQKPFELACYLLADLDEWDKSKLRESMAEDKASYRDISPDVPLYIIYYTIYPNPKTGVVETWPDWYGYDKLIAQQMGALVL